MPKAKDRTGSLPPYPSVRRFAQAHDVSESTVWRWIKKGIVEAIKFGDGTTRVNASKLPHLNGE